MTPDNDGDSAQVPAVPYEAAAGGVSGSAPDGEPHPPTMEPLAAALADDEGDLLEQGEGAPAPAVRPAADAGTDEAEELDLDAVEELEASEVLELEDGDGAQDSAVVQPVETGAGSVAVASSAAAARAGRVAAPVVRRSSEILEALRQESPAARIDALRRELAAEQVPWRRAVLDHEIGVRLELAGDAEAAAEAWGRALVEDPSLKPNLWALREVCERRADWPNLGALLIAEARAAGTAGERAELYFERGLLLDDHLGDVEGAQAAFRTAVAEDPAALPALMALERRALRASTEPAALRQLLASLAAATGEPGRRGELLVELSRLEAGEPDGHPFERLREALSAGGSPGRILDEAERLAHERSDGAELLRVVEGRATIAESGTEPRSDERLVDLRRYQASLLRATEPERARACLESCLTRVPHDALLLSDLADLALDEERWSDAAALLARLERAVAPAVARRVALARGRALRRAGQEDDATFAESVAGDGVELRALRCAERQEQAAAAGDMVSLLAALDEEAALAAEAGDSTWQARALVAAAGVRDRHGDAAAALAGCRAAVEANPDDVVALLALDGALARAGLDAERAQVLERRLGLASGDQAAALLDELVELRFDRLGDADGARLAAEALCRARAGVGGLAEAAARARLIEIERLSGRWPEAADQLSRMAMSLREAEAFHEAIDAELARAEILERLGDTAGALSAIDAALGSTPDHEAAHAARRRLLAQAGDWEGMASSLRREADACTEPARLARVLVELAQLLDGRLARRDDAARAWREAAERAPGALSSAPSWHRPPASDAPPMGQARGVEAEVLGAPEAERGQGWLRVGELLEQAGSSRAEAHAAFARSAAVAGPARPHAALGLFRMAARGGDEVALDGALGALAAHADARGASALAEARALIAVGNGDVDGARDRLDDAVRADPSQWSPRLSFVRLSARGPRVERLAEALDGVAAHTRDARLASVLTLRSAILKAAGGGLTAARQALEARPGEGDTPAAPPQARRVVRAVLGAEDRDGADGAGSSAVTALGAAEQLLRSGRLAEASAAATEVASLHPHEWMATDLLRRIARAGGDRLGEARALHSLSAAVRSPARAAALLEQAAPVLLDLGDRAEAAQAYRTLARLVPDDAGHRHRAVALLEELGDTTTLEAMLDERIARAPQGNDEHRALLLERGQLRARTGRPRAAAEDLETVLGAAPDDPRALEALAALRAETGDRTGAAFLLERRLQGARATEAGAEPVALSGEDRALLLRLLELYQGLGGVDGIRRTLRRLDPRGRDDLSVRARAAEALERYGDAAGALEQLSLLASHEPDPSARGRMELRIATLHRDGLGDLAGARAALGRALAIDPLDLEVLGALMPLCVTGDDRILRDAALTRSRRAAQALVEAEPESAHGYQVLERILDWQGDDDGRQLALQAAAAIAATPIPPRRGGLEPTLELSSELFDAAFPPDAWGPARSLWRDTHEAAQRLFGVDLGALGVGRATRVNEKGMPAAWHTVDRIARALGVTSYALHAVGGPGDVCATAGESLAVGSAFGGNPGPDERFQVARKLVLLRDRLGPLEAATDESLELFFAACAQVAQAEWSEGRHLPASRVEEWAKVVDRTLDRRARRALQDQAAQFKDLVEVGNWRRAVLAGANRIALAVAGDLSACLTELRLDPASAAGRALVRFAVSDEIGAMRRAMGQRS